MTLTGSSRKGDALTQFRQVYCWQLKRGRMIGVLYLVLTLLCFTAIHISESVSLYQSYFSNHSDEWAGYTKQQLLEQFSSSVGFNFSAEMGTSLIPIALIFLVVLTVRAFRYMHNRRSVDLFHALPVQRTPLLLGNLAAVYTILALGLMVNLLICGIVDLALGAAAPFTVGWLLGNLGYELLLLAATLLWTVFLLVCCGTVSGAVLAGIFLGLGWPILCVCGASIIQTSLPGCDLYASFEVVSALVPYLAIFAPSLGSGMYWVNDILFSGAGRVDELATISPWVVLWWALVTVLLLAGCVLVYRKRKSEAAENHFSYPVLRVAIRFLASAAFGLICGTTFGSLTNSSLAFYLAVLIGSALAHVVTQVIWVRGVKQLTRSLPAYGALVVCLAVFFVGVATGGLGYVTRIPEIGDVDYARVSLPSIYHYDDSAATYLGTDSGLWVDYTALKSEPNADEDDEMQFDVMPKLTGADSLSAVTSLQKSLIDLYDAPYLPAMGGDYDADCTLEYHLKNGKVMRRMYRLPYSDVDYEDLEQYAEDPRATPEVLKQMAAVVALKPYQDLSLFDQITADRVTSAGFERYNDKESIYGNLPDELTKEQQKQLWNTFREEVSSDDFVRTFQEQLSVGESETNYWITVDSTWEAKDWTDEIRQRVQDNREEDDFDPETQRLVRLSSHTDRYDVPKSCKKTRALIKKYVGDNISRENYEEGLYD